MDKERLEQLTKLLNTATKSEKQFMQNKLKYDVQVEIHQEQKQPFKTLEQLTKTEYLMYRGCQQSVIMDIIAERHSQMSKWGYQRHPIETWMTILMEEVGEAFQAINATLFSGKESDPTDLYAELVQTAAVTVAILEQIEERNENEQT